MSAKKLPTLLRDHPRSRGVYTDLGAWKHEGDGSSPLARGLPDLLASIHALPGIIPARAGFTLSPMMRIICGKDHPRSRGVYAMA